MTDDLLLPGAPPPLLAAVWEALTAEERAALLPHLLGPTSAEWLAGTLNGCGFSISATTIRTYRRSLRE